MHQPQTDCDESSVVIPAAGARFVAEDGTVSVVLEEAVDANYSPTEEEIEEFAEWMGMKLPEDREFLYIASEALRARLPNDWRACRTDGDEVYYFNFRTGESTWKHPMDDFYRQKFLEKKELKKKGGAKRKTTTTTTTGGGGPLHVENDNGSGINNRSGSNNNSNNNNNNNNNSNTAGGGGGPVSILRKLPAELAGGTSTTATLTHAFVPPLGPTSRALPSTSPRDSRLVADVFKPPTSTSHAGSERRIVSEAERNLEEKLRREREAAFVAEEEKAEAAHRERLQEMRRAHEEEVKKLQSKLEEKRVLIEKQTASNDGEEHAGKEREELVKRLRKSIDENLQEEKDLQQKLLKIKEQHAQRVASAVAKVETAAKEKYERERKDLQAELAASQKELESETQAEFAAKRAELQKKSQEELQRLKEDAERRHQIEMKALRERYTKEQKSVDNTVEGKGGKTCLHAKEKEMVAAIENKSKKDQAEFSATMEATLRRLRRELCELEGPVTVTLGNSTNTSQINEVLDPVRRHWKDEERKRMQTLEEERRNKLASVERMQPPSSVSSSSPVSTTKSTTTTTNNNDNNDNSVEGIRAANEAILAAKEKYLEETEMLLRTTLQEELAHSDLALDVQIQEAVKDDVKVFVRSTEVRRKLEREDFERRRDAALAENKKAKELYEKRVAEQMAKLEEESRVEMEEMMSEAVQGEVEKIVRAMTVEREAAERKLKQRYADERGVLFAEVDEEMAAYEKEERGNIFSQEESKAKKRETEMRLSAEKAASMEEVQQQRMKEKTNKMKEEGEGEIDVMSAEMTQQQQQQRASTSSSSSLVVPAEMLRRRLSLIEQTYGEQELALQMELESINTELRRLENAIALQRQRPPQQQSRQQSTINDNNNTSMLPEASPRVASPFSKREKGHASPFASEALRILNQQQQELNARRGALHAAREEWQNGLWYASSSVPSILHSGKPLVPNSHAEENDVNAKLLRVVEALSSRLKEITGCITKMQTTSESPTLHWRQGQKLYSSSDCHHRDRGKDAHEKNYSQKRKWRGRSADAAQRLHQSRSKTQDPAVRLIRKWSQILLEFAVPSQHHSEVSDSIQRLVTYK